MTRYRLDVLLSPDEHLGYRREIQASDDDEAIRRAREFYDELPAVVGLDRFVLYEGARVVYEYATEKP